MITSKNAAHMHSTHIQRKHLPTKTLNTTFTSPNATGPVAEQVLLLENISTSVLVGPEQLPHIHTLMVDAAHMLQMEPPDLYIRQNPVPNAYTLAISGRKPFVVVHTALLELLTPAELQTVLAHELGHLKCDHGLWLTAANVLAMGTVSLLPIVSSRWCLYVLHSTCTCLLETVPCLHTCPCFASCCTSIW